MTEVRWLLRRLDTLKLSPVGAKEVLYRAGNIWNDSCCYLLSSFNTVLEIIPHLEHVSSL